MPRRDRALTTLFSDRGAGVIQSYITLRVLSPDRLRPSRDETGPQQCVERLRTMDIIKEEAKKCTD